MTETTGWVDAWTSQPSVYAVTAETSGDVVAAVNVARDHNLRLVVKGGGHSYVGASNAPDSLLIWTRRMMATTLHDDFVAQGCPGQGKPQPAVTVGAGAIWGHTYDRVTAGGGRYVQGGGCLTVGVAGLVQAGGFGSFSKNVGIAAASLLEAEIITADGTVRIANSCTNADLFWALKGGGGGTFGVVTRVTLKTHPLPSYFGALLATIQASSDHAFRRLIGRFVDFYAKKPLQSSLGGIATLRPGSRLDIRMSFQGLNQQQAEVIWQPFFEWVTDTGRFRLSADAPGRCRPCTPSLGPGLSESLCSRCGDLRRPPGGASRQYLLVGEFGRGRPLHLWVTVGMAAASAIARGSASAIGGCVGGRGPAGAGRIAHAKGAWPGGPQRRFRAPARQR